MLRKRSKVDRRRCSEQRIRPPLPTSVYWQSDCAEQNNAEPSNDNVHLWGVVQHSTLWPQ